LGRGRVGLWARMGRRAARRARQGMRFGSLATSPVFFANSFPKSGTHLLTQVMHGFTQIGPAVDSGLPAVVTFDGFTGRQRGEGEILADLRRFLPGDIGYGHVHAFPAALDFLCQPGMAAYFILRDPRDVVVSHVHYVAEMAPNHIHYRYYHETLHTFDQRLRASIVGVPASELEKATGKPAYEPLPDIRARFEPYLDWMGKPEVLALRYEDFSLDRGAALERVLDHAVQRAFEPGVERGQALQTLAASIDPQRSPTFRSGKVGGWRNSFSEEHQQLFQKVAGDLLARLGYDQ
jgi:sulfotransferase 6B1